MCERVRQKLGHTKLCAPKVWSCYIRYTSKDADIFEEILIVDEISLIGSLGGSLGLFIGFSFFGYITTLLDVIVDKIFYMSTP